MPIKIINTSKNTVYLEDIDQHIQYDNKEISYTDDELKKSRCLRNFIISEHCKIISNDNTQIQNSIIYLKNKHKPLLSKKTEHIEEFVNTVENKNIEVKIHGIFYDASGYAKVNRNLAYELDKLGVKVKVDPKNSVNQLKESELAPIVKLSNNTISKKHILIDSIIPTFAEASSGKYKILYTTIESYSIPPQFLESCQLYNEIWLTSQWSASILKKQIPEKPIYVVVPGINETLYSENGEKFNLGSQVNGFVFLSVFSWSYRKGYDVLLNAYMDEFSSKDDVSLILMSRYQSGRSRYEKNKIKEDIDKIMLNFPNKDLPQVVRLNKILDENDMPKLYRACNAYVSLTRGEGIGLTPMEASACGLPVIMTNCSGQQEYLRTDNSYCLEIDRIEKIKQGEMHIHYWDNQEFPYLKTKEFHNLARKALRDVYNNYIEAKKKNEKLRNMILNQFTWKNTAQTALQRLQEIQKML
jgi:glycosyltransferase involved in cell wall biosynthesis